MIVNIVDWQEIDWVPKVYSKGFASFSHHKKKHFWLAVFLTREGKELMGVGKVLFLSKNHARHCSLFTIPAFRKMGVIRKIIHAQEKLAIENGCTKIDAIADASHQYWMRYGYMKKEYQGKNQWRFESIIK